MVQLVFPQAAGTEASCHHCSCEQRRAYKFTSAHTEVFQKPQTPLTQVTEQQKVFLHFLQYWSKQTANFSSSETQQTPLRKQGSSEIKRGRVMKVRFMKKRLWVCEKCYRLPGFKVRFGVSLCFTVLSSYLYRNYFYTKYCRVNMVYVKQQSTLFFSTLKKVHFSP